MIDLYGSLFSVLKYDQSLQVRKTKLDSVFSLIFYLLV